MLFAKGHSNAYLTFYSIESKTYYKSRGSHWPQDKVYIIFVCKKYPKQISSEKFRRLFILNSTCKESVYYFSFVTI